MLHAGSVTECVGWLTNVYVVAAIMPELVGTLVMPERLVPEANDALPAIAPSITDLDSIERSA
jgi:hypothetical protein